MIFSFSGNKPRISANAFVAENAVVLGDVHLGEDSSVWFGSVLRGDVGAIRVGARTNVQDLTVIHVTTDRFDTTIGDDVTIGHRAIVHGCVVEDRVLIGMGAVVMDGAVIEHDTVVGAGTLITPGTRVPSGSLVLGSPGRVVRPLRNTECQELLASAHHYVEIARRHGRESERL